MAGDHPFYSAVSMTALFAPDRIQSARVSSHMQPSQSNTPSTCRPMFAAAAAAEMAVYGPANPEAPSYVIALFSSLSHFPIIPCISAVV